MEKLSQAAYAQHKFTSTAAEREGVAVSCMRAGVASILFQRLEQCLAQCGYFMGVRVDMGDMVGPAHSTGPDPEEHSLLERMGRQVVAAEMHALVLWSLKGIAAGIRQT